MACNYTRQEISEIVVGVISDIENDATITEESEFSPQDINNDATFRSGYYDPIRMSVEKDGCLLTKFSPADCEKASSVGDIVNAVWKDVKPA
jgi:hypothetical protein